ncbi:hypothetical protein EIP86_002733 [Pleurotus ostreatoroseus]|nr:hypothetical protein EIP86_002733 [Pleurotus ostreatoroseus]
MPHKRAKRSVREQSRSQQGDNLAPSKHAISSEAIPKGAARILNAAKVQQAWHDKKRKSSEDGPHDAIEGKANKRRRKASKNDSNGARDKIQIMPGESLAHFNRRVEESMRPLVRDAVKTSAAVNRKTKKEEEAAAASAKASKAKRAAAASATHDDSEDADAESSSSKTKSKPSQAHDDPSGSTKRPKTQTQMQAQAQAHDASKDFETLSTSAPRRLNDIVQAPPELKKLPRGAKARKQTAAAASAGGASEGAASLRDGVLSMAQKVMLEEERERAIKAYRELKKRKTDS